MSALRAALKSWPPYVGAVGGIILAWIALFSWSVCVTVYNDHQDLVAANSQLKKQNDALKSPPLAVDSSNQLGVVNPENPKSHTARVSKKQVESPAAKMKAPVRSIPPALSLNCTGSNCAATNNGTQSMTNVYGVPQPPPSITSINRTHLDPKAFGGDPATHSNPGIRLDISLSGIFYNPIFAFRCDRPCYARNGSVTPGGASPNQLVSKDPTIGAISFNFPSTIQMGQTVSIMIQSADDKDISILDVEPYVPPRP